MEEDYQPRSMGSPNQHNTNSDTSDGAAMKIFITGVAGFLGSHLADRMLQLGHTVAGNDSLIGGYRDNVDPRVEFHLVDCTDQKRMAEAMKGSDVVVHCAATAHEGLSVFSPDFITKNIFGATVATVSAAIAIGLSVSSIALAWHVMVINRAPSQKIWAQDQLTLMVSLR